MDESERGNVCVEVNITGGGVVGPRNVEFIISIDKGRETVTLYLDTVDFVDLLECMREISGYLVR